MLELYTFNMRKADRTYDYKEFQIVRCAALPQSVENVFSEKKKEKMKETNFIKNNFLTLKMEKCGFRLRYRFLNDDENEDGVVE